MASIKKNFLYSSILTTANYIFPLLTFPYVTRVLGVEGIGICSFIDSVINYFILFSVLGMSVVGTREIARCKDNTKELNKTFSSLFLFNTFSTSIALLVLIIAIFTIPQLHKHYTLMLIGAVKLLFNYMLIEWLYKGLEEFKFITIRTLLVKVAYVISVYVFVKSPVLSLLTVCANAIINVAYSSHYVKLKISGVNILAYSKSTIIMGLYGFLTSMYSTFNIAYLGFVSGETEVGFYTVASKMYGIIIALFSSFTGVMLPRMSSLVSQNRFDEFHRLFSKSMNILFLFSIPVILFFIIYAPYIVEIIAGSGYDRAVTPMRIMMPLIFIIGYEQILIIQTLMPLKRDKSILINSLIGSIVGLSLNIVLVYWLKSSGSAIVWLLSELSVLICAQYQTNKCLNVSFPLKKLLSQLINYTPLLICLLAIYYLCKHRAVSLLSALVFMVTYSYILNYYIIKDKLFVSIANNLFSKAIVFINISGRERQ